MQNQSIICKVAWIGGVKAVFCIMIVLSVFFSYEIGNRHFADPDEGRYVEISREMIETGDFITPKLNGLKYFEKPPLFYWMQAGVINAFGINEVSMRLLIVVFAVLGCCGVFLVGAKCYSPPIGMISSAILATNVLYYAHSRLIILDLVMAVLMSGSLWCFFVAFVHKSWTKMSVKKTLIFMMYVFAALSCLTKGLIGIFLPGMIVFLWMAFTKNWSKIKEMLYIPGILIFFIISAPWHVIVALRNSDFLYFYFIVEHFLRYATTIHNRYQPLWFFIPVLLVGLLPWTGFSLVAVKNSFKNALSKKPEDIFLISWILGVFIFFSFSRSKLISYILPLLPPLALITGATLVESFDSKNKDCIMAVWSNIALFTIAFVAYTFAKVQITDVLQNINAVILIKIFFWLLLLNAVILMFFIKISKIVVVFSYIFVSANMMLIFNKAAVLYQGVKKPTTKHAAQIINLNRNSGDLVFCYKRYYQDFPVYLNSTVGVVDFIGELEFGANADKNNDKLITEKKFWDLWNSKKQRIFLLLSRKHYKKVFSTKSSIHNILDFNEYFVVISNK